MKFKKKRKYELVFTSFDVMLENCRNMLKERKWKKLNDPRCCPECLSMNTKGYVEHTTIKYYELDKDGKRSDIPSDLKEHTLQDRTGCVCLDCGYEEDDDDDQEKKD